MKKWIIPLLSLLLALLTACGRSGTPTETPTLVSPALTAQLNRLRDGVQPGTAGSSLKAAIVAADLLDWAAEPAPQENIEATVKAWLADQSAETLALLPEQSDSLRWTVAQLTEHYDASAGLLEDAGLTGRGPWKAATAETVFQLLTLLESGVQEVAGGK